MLRLASSLRTETEEDAQAGLYFGGNDESLILEGGNFISDISPLFRRPVSISIPDDINLLAIDSVLNIGYHGGTLMNLTRVGGFAVGDVGTLNNGNAITLDDTEGTLVVNLTQTIAMTAPNGFTLNEGQPIKGFLSASDTVDPISMGDGDSIGRTAISMPGVVPGDVIFGQLDSITNSNWTAQAACSAADLAEITFTNRTGGVVDLPIGVIKLLCIRF